MGFTNIYSFLHLKYVTNLKKNKHIYNNVFIFQFYFLKSRQRSVLRRLRYMFLKQV